MPSETSTWRRPSSRSQAIRPSTRPWRIAISVSVPPSTTGMPCGGVALELGPQVGGHERRAPAELDDVDEPAGDLQQAVHLRDRQAPVDHVGDAVLARLDRARGDVEEAGYGTRGLVGADDHHDLAEPASGATAASSGCTLAHARARARRLRRRSGGRWRTRPPSIWSAPGRMPVQRRRLGVAAPAAADPRCDGRDPSFRCR